MFLPNAVANDSVTGVPTTAGSTIHYDDDGHTQAYKTNAAQRTRVSYTLAGDALSLTIHAATGSYAGAHPSRSYSVRLHYCVPPAQVSVDGVVLPRVAPESVMRLVGANTWHYDAQRATVVVSLYQRFDVAADVVVELALPTGQQTELRPLLASVPGLIGRAKVVKAQLDGYYPSLFPVRETCRRGVRVCTCVCDRVEMDRSMH